MEMSTKGSSSPKANESLLMFGPQWIRDLSDGNNAPQSEILPMPKFKIAQYRYGREEMLALFSKSIEMPDFLKEFDQLAIEKCQMPIAMLPVEDEQRIWARPTNNDGNLRGTNKGQPGLGSGMTRGGGRGGSVDRGRGRGRGGYHSRGYSFENGDDASVGSYSRLRPVERSQSANEKEQRWEERDRRYERPLAGRNSGVLDDPLNIGKSEGSRAPNDNWRRIERDDENDWRSSNTRAMDRYGNRGGGGSWRNHNEKENQGEIDYKEKAHNKDTKLNGPMKNPSNHPRQRSSSGRLWGDDVGDVLPEWSVVEDSATDVGSFDSSGAFLETKGMENECNKEEVFNSSNEESKSKESSPSSKTVPKSREKTPNIKKVTIPKPPAIQNIPPPVPAGAGINAASTTVTAISSCEAEHSNKSVKISQETFHVPQTETLSKNLNSSAMSTTVSSVMTNSSLLQMQNNVVNVSSPMSLNDVVGSNEEDAFAHHKTATENMVALWAREDDHKVLSEPADKGITVLPLHNEDAYKWFYRDPQGEIQGPFPSTVMLDWFNTGFFTKELQIKRGCDEKFEQLGNLTQMWKRIPFSPGAEPPPMRAASVSTDLPTPFTQSVSLPNHNPLSAQYSQTNLLQQQQQQQLIQQLFRQVQMQQTINQMKQLDSFSSLPSQRQTIILQQLLALQEQQVPRSTANVVGDSPAVDPALSGVPFPLLGLNIPSSILKSDLSLWGLNQNPGRWPSGQPTVSTTSSNSIWDMEASIPPPMPAPSNSVPIEARELEKRMAAEEEEKQRLALEAVKRLEEEKRKEEKRKEEERRKEEEKRKEEELIRRVEEERLRQIQRKKEKEQKELEDIQRLKEQEQQRLENILKEERRLEELKREKLKKEEEQKKLEEQKRIAELEEQNRRKLQEEERKWQKEEEKRRKEEEKRLKEEGHRRHEEALKEEIRMQEEQRQQEESQKKRKEQEDRKEMERVQKEAQRRKEQEELEAKMRREAEKERELQVKKEQEMKIATELKSPAWGRQVTENTDVEMSLADIQRLQEQKEKEERERLKFQQQVQQHHQNLQKQVQSSKNGLSWAKRATESFDSVKSLAEIQMEEAEHMAQQQKVQKTAATTVQATAASGVWGNSSHLNRASNTSGWNLKNDNFWDDALKSTTPVAQKTTKSNECAFPTLSNSVKPANQTSNKNKNVRAKKNEEAVLRLFETHRKPNDEFTSWCTDALVNFPSSVDVPTFVAFLKDVESPYEVYDYVRSYLGEGKEAKEFGKQFLERRSKYRNQTKQSPAEENMWGPAPAITPSVNKTSAQTPIDCDLNNGPKSKNKKKKNKMQKVDNSMLGFTVQPNPDRINVGEIDRIE